MKIDVNAFLNSLPIMGVGLLGIFIVTAVIIIGIYVLKALTAKSADAEAEAESMYPAIDALIDKVDGQLVKYKEKMKS